MASKQPSRYRIPTNDRLATGHLPTVEGALLGAPPDGAPLLVLDDLVLTATAGGGCDLIVPALGTGVRIPYGVFLARPSLQDRRRQPRDPRGRAEGQRLVIEMRAVDLVAALEVRQQHRFHLTREAGIGNEGRLLEIQVQGAIVECSCGTSAG